MHSTAFDSCNNHAKSDESGVLGWVSLMASAAGDLEQQGFELKSVIGQVWLSMPEAHHLELNYCTR